MSASTEGGNSEVTVILMNYRRPENFPRILDCLAAQTARPRVWVWDNADALLRIRRNGSESHCEPAGDMFVDGCMPLGRESRGGFRALTDHTIVDRHVRAGTNFGCFARWWLATQVETPMVAVLDDDLVLADDDVLADAIATQRDRCPDGIVGTFGWEAVPGRTYRGARHVNGSRTDRCCDVVKGRFMVLASRLVARLWDGPPVAHPDAAMWRRCDDIYVSTCVSGGRPGRHLVPGVLGMRWRECGRQDGRALASDPGHYEERDRAVALLREHFSTRAPVPITT